MNAKVKAFLDTNILIYLYSQSELIKQETAEKFISQYDCFISTQVLNEYCSASLSKMKIPIDRLQFSVNEIVMEFSVIPVNQYIVLEALALHEKYLYNYWDCLILAAAIQADCKYLFSEDMQDGQMIENSLTIKNIFV